MRYQEFIIRFESCEEQCRVSVESPAGEARQDFQLPVPADQFGPLLASIERSVSLREGIFEREGVLISEGEPGVALPPSPVSMTAQEFGQRLFDALFSGQIAVLYDRSWGKVTQEPDQGLRIRLQFDLTRPDIARLASLPWEYLYRQPIDQFLALDRRSPVLRYIELPHKQETYKLPIRLRILVIAASPSGMEPIGIVKERDKIIAAWESDDVEIIFLKKPTLDSTIKALTRKTEEEIHVVHFIGHGGFDERVGGSVLYFENEERGHRAVSGQVFADILRAYESVRMIFLNCCHSARSASHPGEDPFTGVATALVQSGIPVVLGMQFPISDPAAIRFSDLVYQSLAKGDSLDTATAIGRLALHAEDGRSLEWGTPVLFSRTTDARIFDAGGLSGPDDLVFWSWLWTGNGLLTAYITFIVWASTISLGSNTNLHLPGLEIETGPYSAAIFGILLGAPLTLIQTRIAQQFDRTFRPKDFWSRFPLPFGFNKSRLGRFRKRVQAMFLVLFLLIPVAGQVHFFNKMVQGEVWSRKGNDYTKFTKGIGHFTHRVHISVVLTDDYRHDVKKVDGESGEGVLERKGVTFFPFWQPWFSFFLLAGVLTYFLSVIRRLIRR